MELSALKGRCSSWGCKADWWASSICSRAGIPAAGSTAPFHSSISAWRRALDRWRATTIPWPRRGNAQVRIKSGMANIPVGTVGEEKLLVTSEVTINFLEMEGARVLSTPHMIGYMERTSRNTVLPLLEPGHDTVGTHVNVSHLAATPVGMTVTFRAEVTGGTGRRVQFRVEAWDEKEKVGEGTHERAIINIAKFATRLAEKLK